MIRPRRDDRAVLSKPLPGDELVLLHASYRDQRFSKHTHDTYVVGVNEAGTHEFTCRGASWHASPYTVGVVEPGEAHTGERVDGEVWKYRAFYPSVDFMRRVAHGVPHFAEPVIHDPAIARALVRAHRLYESTVDPVAAESAFLEALRDLVTRHSTGTVFTLTLESRAPHARRAVSLARDFLHTSYARPVALADLATVSGLSRFHLLRAFEAETGLPPYTYLLQLRVERAKRLLESGVPISRAAVEVGFADQSHLHRHFKRFVGVTPGVFVRAKRR